MWNLFYEMWININEFANKPIFYSSGHIHFGMMTSRRVIILLSLQLLLDDEHNICYLPTSIIIGILYPHNKTTWK